MHYASIGITALIIHIIINRQELNRKTARAEMLKTGQVVALRYRYFLLASICYYISDITWGLMYDHRDIPELFALIYSDTVFYFIFMLLTMLTWIRYVVSYLDKRRRRSKALLYAVWLMFT
ncbi:MAG: GGDEF domain-containing protein, partial [Lachnospiraceae bacterium]|nr:GGDEF domain-containing protein [Lachnospiraceae bacterium]